MSKDKEVTIKDKESNDWWWKEPDKEKESKDKSPPEDQQKTLYKESKQKEVKQPPRETLEPEPESPFPKELHAHFELIDISGTFRKIRGLPHFFPIERLNILIGIEEKAHIKLDDTKSVRGEHAKLICKEKGGEKRFVIYSIGDAPVFVNGDRVSAEGVSLKSEDRLKIGSADLIFFQADFSKKEKKTNLPKQQETSEKTEKS